jgi:hypothetical protein
MGGGLLQLVAYGAQDVYLTGNPQITFFKVVYRRHTNFAIESIQQTFNGTAGFGNTVNVTISRNGDLINRTYLQLKVPGLGSTASTDKYANYFGLRVLKNVTVEIGGQQIDKHYSDWMYIWNELSLPLGKKHGYESMVGADGYELAKQATTAKTSLYIPLEFWFCRNVGLALPLIALQYHEVKLKIEFEDKSKCVTSGALVASNSAFPNGQFAEASIWVDYIFLDTDERRRFAQLSHEYLIEQLQYSNENVSSGSGNKFRLNFNHPCKELVWAVKKSDTADQWYNYTKDSSNFNENIVGNELYPAGKNPVSKALLQLNGNDRFAERDGSYFNYVQPYQHHTNIPTNKGINVYSFALKPEEHQPSGTLNMSRIDTAVLSITSDLDASDAKIYAVNYNVLRIMSGMGGLAYSN